MTKAPENPNLNGLVALSNRSGVDIRPTLLRVVTDLYLRTPTHSEKEETEYTRMALRLLNHVDAKTRAMIAEKIAGYPNAPAAVRQRLLKDHITVKAPEPARAPVKADARPLPKTNAAAVELNELFFACSAEERRLILLNLPYAPAEPVEPVAAQAASHRLEAAALAHQPERFARDLGRALSISRAQALRVANDPGGEPIVVAAAALQMPAAVLARILLCLNPVISRSVQRVYDLTLLHQDLKAASALRLVAIWQAADREEQRPPVSAPVAVAASQPTRRTVEERMQPAVPVARPKISWDEHAMSRKDSA
jgi:hypothetical protein